MPCRVRGPPLPSVVLSCVMDGGLNLCHAVSRRLVLSHLVSPCRFSCLLFLLSSPLLSFLLSSPLLCSVSAVSSHLLSCHIMSVLSSRLISSPLLMMLCVMSSRAFMSCCVMSHCACHESDFTDHAAMTGERDSRAPHKLQDAAIVGKSVPRPSIKHPVMQSAISGSAISRVCDPCQCGTQAPNGTSV